MLRRLVSWLERAGIERFEVHNEGMSLRILMDVEGGRARGAAKSITQRPSAPDQESVGKNVCLVLADASGTFLVAHPMQTEPFVQRGDVIQAGQVLGLLKIGMLYKAVLAEKAGTVKRLLAAQGDRVESNVPLFEMESL